jgi:hypothetical protein
MRSEPRQAVAAGTVVTAALFLFSQGYPYAPIVGGLVAGTLAGQLRTGGQAGAALGLVFVPVSLLLVGIGLALPSSLETGVDVLFRSFRGMGSMNAVFYLVVAFYITVYTTLVGGLFGTIGGGLSQLIRHNHE